MPLDPYRSGSSPPAPVIVRSDSGALGAHRASCAPPTLGRALVPAFTTVLLIAFVGATTASLRPGLFALVLPFAVLGFAVLAWSPIRRRRLRVDLYEFGATVSNGDRLETVSFDTVDEVWMSISAIRNGSRMMALIRGLRLVLHDGSVRRIPTDLRGAEKVVRAVVVHCSHPLQSQAESALAVGETLRFGRILLDSTCIRGRSWSARWDEVSLVRYAPGRIFLFRGQTVFPWRTIRLDEVPHPTVFSKLVKRYAPKTQVDDTLAEGS